MQSSHEFKNLFFDRARRSQTDFDLSSNDSPTPQTDDEDFQLPNDEQIKTEEVTANTQEMLVDEEH